ncbi:MAG: ferrous iron transporter B, partial [Clostridia bacterium]|nr:ferrous iron transporter B [Clostridia bacterium]
MSVKIALAGNPNSGKTTLFNSLTGSNQFVGNWPGVTVEKKEGKLKGHKDVTIMDLPGIYSLSPYTLEEVVARNYLINERPDAILNIVDGTNLERNLYLTTQLAELGIPVVMAVNMMDVVNKSGNELDFEKLSKVTGCEVVPISALKGTGIKEAADKAVAVAGKSSFKAVHSFDDKLEGIISEIEGKIGSSVPEEQKRFYAIKLFERDDKINGNLPDVSDIIEKAEKEYDDDSESIITNARYEYITSIIKDCYKKKVKRALTTSDKIDRVVTNRWLALPIFAVIMFLVYYIAVTTVGTYVTDWTNDGLFGADGNGWHLFGIGSKEYSEAVDKFYEKHVWSQVSIGEKLNAAADKKVVGASELLTAYNEQDAGAFEEAWGSYGDSLADAENGKFDITPELAAVGIAEAPEEEEKEAKEEDKDKADNKEEAADGKKDAVTADDAKEAENAPDAEKAPD